MELWEGGHKNCQKREDVELVERESQFSPKSISSSHKSKIIILPLGTKASTKY